MKYGTVYLVGAGTGAPDLITLRGLRALRKSDVIICDSLIPKNFLEELGIPTSGKTVKWLDRENHSARAQTINDLILASVKSGKVVARLKIGDPFIYGRFHDELGFIAKHNIGWEVIPGLSAAIAAPELAHLPLTWRHNARSFAVSTARCEGGNINRSYPKSDSLILLMGVSAIGEVAEKLVADGWRLDTPCAIIERASMLWERRVEGTLGNIAKIAGKNGVSSPAVIVVGKAAEKRGAISASPRILFTGFEPAPFRPLGEILHYCALALTPDELGARRLDGVIEELRRGQFRWTVFTSGAAVKFFFGALREKMLDARLLADSRVAACGELSKETLFEYGITADFQIKTHKPSEIISALAYRKDNETLIIKGRGENSIVENALTKSGIKMTLLSLYRAVPHPELGQFPLPPHDVIYFTSAQGVRAFFAAYGEAALSQSIWCLTDSARNELLNFGFRSELVKPAFSAAEFAAEFAAI
ncbi:MAG: hypothetical protein Kow0090_01820 [Myxococcota bacterium]